MDSDRDTGRSSTFPGPALVFEYALSKRESANHVPVTSFYTFLDMSLQQGIRCSWSLLSSLDCCMYMW